MSRVDVLVNNAGYGLVSTTPYFHNGAVKDLKEVVRIMSKYQIGDEFTSTQIDEVVEFLKSFDGELVEYEIR